MSLEVRDPEMMWKLMKQINRIRPLTPPERLIKAIRESGGVTGNEADEETTSEVSNVYPFGSLPKLGK